MKLDSNRGSALVTVLIVVVIAAGMALTPLLITAKGTDDAIKLTVQTATSNYANKIKTTGDITQEDYDNFILDLSSTGKAFNVDINVQVLDDNAAKKASSTKGSGTYYNLYTTQVSESLPLDLKDGDTATIIVTMVSDNWLETFAGAITGNGDKDKEIARETVMITGNPNR